MHSGLQSLSQITGLYLGLSVVTHARDPDVLVFCPPPLPPPPSPRLPASPHSSRPSRHTAYCSAVSSGTETPVLYPNRVYVIGPDFLCQCIQDRNGIHSKRTVNMILFINPLQCHDLTWKQPIKLRNLKLSGILSPFSRWRVKGFSPKLAVLKVDAS